MNRLTPSKKKPKNPNLGYGDANPLIMAFLSKNPDSTASHIEIATGLPIATINFELNKYRAGEHEEPRYEMSGYGMGPIENSRPAQLWRLATEPLSAAKRRMAAALEKVGRVLIEHPELAGEAVTRVMALAKASDDRRNKSKKKK